MSQHLPENDRIAVAAPAAGTTQISFDFQIFADDELVVVRFGADNSRETFTVNNGFELLSGIGGEGGGTITLTTASVENDKYLLLSNATLSRETGFTSLNSLKAGRLNLEFDNLLRFVQEVAGLAKQAIKFHPSTSEHQTWIFPGLNGETLIFDGQGNLVPGPSAASTILQAELYANAAKSEAEVAGQHVVSAAAQVSLAAGHEAGAIAAKQSLLDGVAALNSASSTLQTLSHFHDWGHISDAPGSSVDYGALA